MLLGNAFLGRMNGMVTHIASLGRTSNLSHGGCCQPHSQQTGAITLVEGRDSKWSNNIVNIHWSIKTHNKSSNSV